MKAKWGGSKVTFLAATKDKGGALMTMIAAGYPLKQVHAAFKDELEGCAYDAFRIYANRYLTIPKAKPITRQKVFQHVRSAEPGAERESTASSSRRADTGGGEERLVLTNPRTPERLEEMFGPDYAKRKGGTCGSSGQGRRR